MVRGPCAKTENGCPFTNSFWHLRRLSMVARNRKTLRNLFHMYIITAPYAHNITENVPSNSIRFNLPQPHNRTMSRLSLGFITSWYSNNRPTTLLAHGFAHISNTIPSASRVVMWFELNMTDEKLTENQCRDTFTLKPSPPCPTTTTTEVQLLFLRLADNTMSTTSNLLLYIVLVVVAWLVNLNQNK